MNFLKELLAIKEASEIEDADEKELDAKTVSVDDQIHDQLNKASEDDAIDTQCFGLEMEDGQVVKVYVKQDQAEDFETALSKRLGEDDDIQATLDELGKEYEIVKVVWPDEDDESSDEDDTENEDELEDDGSDSLNSNVDYSDTKEQLSYGRKFVNKLSELKWTTDEHDAYKNAAAQQEEPDTEDEQDEEPVNKQVASGSKWTVDKNEDGIVISNDRFKLDLDVDEANDLSNKISDKQVARFKNEHGKIVYVFSPKGSEYILKTPEYQGGFKIPVDVLDQIIGDD